MRVLVTGGRKYRDRQRLYLELDRLHEAKGIDLVIQGGATGADALARDWCAERMVSYRNFPANWSLGRAAGPIRNAEMLKEGRPDLVVAFPGGDGTADMVSKARRAGVAIMEIPV